MDRRDRDVQKGVIDKNKFYQDFFRKNGFELRAASHLGLRFIGKVNGYNISITLNNSGGWENVTSRLKVVFETDVQALTAVGSFIPFLLRAGMQKSSTKIGFLKVYSNDFGWTKSLLNSVEGIRVCDSLKKNDYFILEPNKLIWDSIIDNPGDVSTHLTNFTLLLNKIKRLAAPNPVKNSFVRRNKKLLLLLIGVVTFGVIAGITALFFI